VSRWQLWAAASVSLAGSLLLGSATPSATPPGETISLAGWSHGDSPSRQHFEIKTSSPGPLFPGATRNMRLTIVNPNPFPIAVRAIKGRLASTSHPRCKAIAANLQVHPYAGQLPLVIRSFSRRDVGQIEIHMPNSVVDACQWARFDIRIDSDATRLDR
jgi:hypothetical protein